MSLTHLAPLCGAIDLGIECSYRAVMTSPVPLCEEHRIQIALLVVPEILADALRSAQSPSASRGAPAAEMDALAAGAVPVNADSYRAGAHGPVVYFIANGQRVKIGTTTNLCQRIKSLSLQGSDAALLVRGGPMLERALHRRFSHQRIDATEWFTLEGPIEDYIAIKHDELAALAEDEADQREAAAVVAVISVPISDTEPAATVPGIEPEPDIASDLLGDTAPEEVPVVPTGPTYPDGTPIEAKTKILWATFSAMDSARVDDLVDLRLPQLTSRDSIRKVLRAWIRAGFAWRDDSGTYYPVPETADEMAR